MGYLFTLLDQYLRLYHIWSPCKETSVYNPVIILMSALRRLENLRFIPQCLSFIYSGIGSFSHIYNNYFSLVEIYKLFMEGLISYSRSKRDKKICWQDSLGEESLQKEQIYIYIYIAFMRMDYMLWHSESNNSCLRMEGSKILQLCSPRG